MKRVQGAVLLLVNVLGAVALVSCAASSNVDPSFQHTSGTCGLQTSADFIHLQKTCADTSSQTSADSCKTESSTFLNRYSGINCTLVDTEIGERQVTEDTIRAMTTKAVNFSAKTDCPHPVARAFNKVLASCVSANVDVKTVVCAEASDRFKEIAPSDVQCTITKSVLGRPANVTQEVVQHLREQAGVDSDAGGACGPVVEAAFLKVEVACAELKTAVDAARCRASADGFTAAYPRANCKITTVAPATEVVDAARIAGLKAKADQIISPPAAAAP